MSLQPISLPQALIVPCLGLATVLAVELPVFACVICCVSIRYSAVPFLEAKSQGKAVSW